MWMGGYHPSAKEEQFDFLLPRARRGKISVLRAQPAPAQIARHGFEAPRAKAPGAARYNVPVTTVSLAGIWHLSAVAGVCDDL
jgi:hypothetical protein